MKNFSLYIVLLTVISGCSNIPSPSNAESVVYADWAYCVEYSHTYDSTISATSSKDTSSIVKQILLNDIQKLQDSLIFEEDRNETLIKYNISAMKDAINQKATKADGENEVDKAYNYCMDTYSEKNRLSTYNQQLLLNPDAGHITTHSLDWGTTGNDCFEFTLLAPHFGTKWLPKLFITYRSSESDEWGQVYLSASSDTSLLSLSYHSKDLEDSEDLLTHIQYFSPIKVGVSFPSQDSLLIKVGEKSYLKTLKFIPDTLNMGATSSESMITVLKENQCSANLTKP